MEAWRAEFYHHGIKGQRWGTRKGPPYPLDAEDHTAAEKKAGWRQSLDKKPKEKEDKPKKHMSSGTKKVIAATAAVAALGVIGAVAASDPKVRELAATGMKAANSALTKSLTAQTTTKIGGNWDPDFERQWRESIRSMRNDEKRFKKTQARSLRERRRAERRDREKFIREHNRQVDAIEKARRQEAARKQANIRKFNRQFNRMPSKDELEAMLREDERKRRLKS